MNKDALGILFTLIGAFLYSAKGVLVKWTIPLGVDAVDILALRMLFAMPFYIISLFYLWYKSKLKVPSSLWGRLIFLGFIGYYASSMLDFHGLHYISAGLERMIIFLYPSFVVLLSFLFKKVKINFRIILALAFSYLGIVFVYVGDTDFNPEVGWIGALLVLLSAFVFAIFLIIGEGLIFKIGAVLFTNIAMLIASFFVLLHFFTVGRSFDFPFQVYMAGFCLGVFGTVIPSYCMNVGISILGTTRASILSTLGPISTLVLSVLVLHESFGVLEIFGITAVILGGLLIKKRQVIRAKSNP